MSWKVKPKQKVRKVPIAKNVYKTFNEGEVLPADYTPPSSYIDTIVEQSDGKILKGKASKKNDKIEIIEDGGGLDA